MATAASVRWQGEVLVVTDSQGNEWLYAKKGEWPGECVVPQVRIDPDGNPKLTGHPFGQDGEGLPRSIGVMHYGAAVEAALGGKASWGGGGRAFLYEMDS